VFVQISNQAVQVGLAESLVNCALREPVLGEPPAIGQQSLRKCTTNCIGETGRMSPPETTHGAIAGEVALPAGLQRGVHRMDLQGQFRPSVPRSAIMREAPLRYRATSMATL